MPVNNNDTQMENLLRQYKPYLLSQVRKFANRVKLCYSSVIQTEDLLQEASAWFVETYKKDGLESALNHRIDLYHTLYEVCRSASPVYLPYWAYGKRMTIPVVPFDTLVNVERADDVERSASIRLMLNSLPEFQRRVVGLKANGHTPKEISQIMGVNVQRVYRALQSAKQALLS